MTQNHPNWGEFCRKLAPPYDFCWLTNYIKSHDINQVTDQRDNTLLHRQAQTSNLAASFVLSYLLIDSNLKNASGHTALQCAPDYFRQYLHHICLCIDFDKASSEPNGLDALFAAIYRGDTTLGDTSGVEDDGNEVNEGGWTALQCAVMYNRPHLIHALHQRFPNIDADYAHHYHFPALRLAAMYGHPDCIIALSECFPAIETVDSLQVACQYNRVSCIPVLHKCFPSLTGNEMSDNEHFYPTALISATRHNNYECIPVLHEYFPNLDPNVQDINGSTALMTVLHGSKSHKCLSVIFGCIPEIKMDLATFLQGDNAFSNFLSQQTSDCLPLLKEFFPNIVNAAAIAAPNLPQPVAAPSGRNPFVTFDDPFGNNPFAAPSEGGHDLNRLAALCGAPIPIGNNRAHEIHRMNRLSALMGAPNDYLCVQPGAATSRGAPVRDPLGHTTPDMLHETALVMGMNPPQFDIDIFEVNEDQNNDEKETKIEYDACLAAMCKIFPNIDPNIQDKTGNTALMHAVRGPIFSMWLKSLPNIDPNIKNNDEDTALICLVKSANCTSKLTRQFIDAFPNVDVNAHDATNKTAFALAFNKRNPLIGAVLLECCPNINIGYYDIDYYPSSTTNHTVLMSAIEQKKIPLISGLLKHLSRQVD